MRIGIDLGGTKIEAIALDDRGCELARKRVGTPRGDYDGTLRAVAALVHALERETGQRGSVGVGIPGAISKATGVVKNANSTWLNGRPLDDDLQHVLKRPLRLANDANCFALSEATDGAATGLDVVFAVIVGTGVGGGIVAHGRVLEGPNGIAGEWGHNPMPWPEPSEWPGPACYCGRTGCIETFLSGPGLTNAYEIATRQRVRPEEIVARAARGEGAAAAVLERHHGRLAKALAHVINVLDPDAIVLGGGLSNVISLYTHVPRLWGPYVFSDRVDTRLLKAAHGDSSGVRGAAWLWATEEHG
jgi:fructokinase